jgi:septum formation protein
LIVLSSTSASRRKLLTQCGIPYKTAKPGFEEEPVKVSMQSAGASALDVAVALAEGKANSIAEILPGAYVIGADQMLECDGHWFDKPADRAAARTHLQTLRGKTHHLITAAVLAHEGKIVWRHSETAKMTMRDFSDAFLDHYLDQAGEGIIRSVGAYELEGAGSLLFDKVDGDFFAILGLPLLPLLAGLRAAGALPT